MRRPLFEPEEWAEVVRELGLSPRKAEIVWQLLEDKKDDAISKALGISKATLRSHMSQMLSRYQVASRVGLAIKVFVAFRRVIEAPRRRHK